MGKEGDLSMKKRTLVAGVAGTLAILAATVFVVQPSYAGNSSYPPPTKQEFDRLDGHGVSGKKVNVIEWHGNLEVHVYPAGSTKGFSAKIDDVENGSKVMVFAYRFDTMGDKKVIRRNILGIPLQRTT